MVLGGGGFSAASTFLGGGRSAVGGWANPSELSPVPMIPAAIRNQRRRLIGMITSSAHGATKRPATRERKVDGPRPNRSSPSGLIGTIQRRESANSAVRDKLAEQGC